MNLDIRAETILSFQQAAKTLPGSPNLSTLHRWRLVGIRGVKLETCMIGGKRYTSAEALARFSERISNAASSPSVTAKARQRSQKSAERKLDASGVVTR